MSRATAAVRFKSDGKILVGLYNGTVDIMVTLLREPGEGNAWSRPAWDEVYHMFKAGEIPEVCSCAGEPAEISTDYGSGSHWTGLACREHMCLHGPLDPHLASNRLWEHHQDGFGIPSDAELGVELPPTLAAFEGVWEGLPDWWP